MNRGRFDGEVECQGVEVVELLLGHAEEGWDVNESVGNGSQHGV